MTEGDGSRDLLVVAGEASGDTHAAELLTALARRRPDLRSFGLGGRACAAAGLERLADSSEISVVGITEVLRILGRARQIYKALLAEVDRRGARTALLVDFPDFNLRLAKALKKRGVRVVYYVSPQVWAWRQGRVRTIARVVDEMLVLFPFELEFYRRNNVEAIHVGHPLVDQVPVLARRRDSEGPLSICLLPGSRRSEIRMHLPVMAQAVQRLAARFDLEARWVLASGLDSAEFASCLPPDLELEIVREDRFRVIADADLALCASGTATLEVGLLGTPMVVVYKVSRLTSWIGRVLLDLPHISLVNLVLGRGVVPEVLQEDATPQRVAAVAADLLVDRQGRHNMTLQLEGLRERLGERGASERAAAVVDRVLAS